MMHYSLLADGQFLDSTETRGAIEVTMGTDDLLPGVQKNMLGMKEGEERSFKLAPEDGFGLIDAELKHTYPKSKFPGGGTDLKKGMAVHGMLGGEMKRALIEDVTEDQVTLDFNHEHAGKVLSVKVKLVEILK